MWSSLTSISRTAVPLFHICRHQIQYNRCYIASHVNQNCVVPSLLRLELNKACLKFSDKTVLLLGKWKPASSFQGNVTACEYVDSPETHGINVNELGTSDTYNYFTCLKSRFLNHSQNTSHSSHSLYRTFKRHKSALYKFTTLQANGQKNSYNDLCQGSTKESDTRFNLLKIDSRHSRQKSCRINSNSKVNQYYLKFETGHIGIRHVNSTLLHRQTKTDYCHYSRTCAFHTSVEKNSAQNEITVRQQPPWRILFFGTDDIALHTLKNLYRDMSGSGSLVGSLEVVTVKEQRAVRAFAESVKLKIHKWPITIETDKYDVGVLVSFGRLIPDAVIHMFPYGILNMHPSLLPRWRGASPVIHTVLNGDDITGVSIMEIRPKHFDIGPLLLQRKCKVPYRCTSLQLANILGPFGANMMLECLKDLPTLERFEHEQDSRGITYAHKLKHQSANIDWESSTSDEIDCQYRAISELMSLKTELDEHTVKLLDVVDPDLLKDINNREIRGYKGDIIHAKPGTVAYHKSQKCVVVRCKEGLIGFRTVVLRKKLTASDFFNGYINKNSCTRFKSLENDLNRYVRMERIPVKTRV